jgi:glycerol 2-dehydrogenase (NADP+)
MHPLLAQNELLAFCKSKDIVITAYTPTGYDTVRSNPTIGAIAKKHGVTPAQVILAWHTARGVVAVPRSKDAQRQKDNITVRPRRTSRPAAVLTLGAQTAGQARRGGHAEDQRP